MAAVVDFFKNVWSKIVEFFTNLPTYLTSQVITYILIGEAVLILFLLIFIICETAHRNKKEKKLAKANANAKPGEEVSSLSKRAYKKQMKEMERKAEYEAVKAQFAKDHPSSTPQGTPASKQEEPAKEATPVVAPVAAPVASTPAEPVDTRELDAKIEKEQELIALLEQEKALLLELEELRARNEQAKKDQAEREKFEKYLSELNSAPVEEEAEETPVEEPVVEEEAEEVPVEEEIPVEEPVAVVAPVEDILAEDDAEEDEEEAEEEEEDEEPEEDDAEEAEEEKVEEPQAKEAAIEIQEFVAVDSEGKPKKIKRKFNTKMMFAPYETKKYYNDIKNYLTLYRAKGRISSRCETFRYKGLVAKVALGGKAVKVYLALDPAIIDEYPKYHLKNFGAKKQYAEVPVMIRVRSDRSLKYFKELVDLLFSNRLIKPNKKFEEQNYLPSLIPNGEAILANLGMETYYLQNTMNPNGIPEEMPDDLIDYIPQIPGEELDSEEDEAVAYLDTLCNHFNDGDEITLDVLKSMHICQKGNILRIKARGTLDRKLIIYAEKYDDDALKMIMCTNGTAVRIVR